MATLSLALVCSDVTCFTTLYIARSTNRRSPAIHVVGFVNICMLRTNHLFSETKSTPSSGDEASGMECFSTMTDVGAERPARYQQPSAGAPFTNWTATHLDASQETEAPGPFC